MPNSINSALELHLLKMRKRRNTGSKEVNSIMLFPSPQLSVFLRRVHRGGHLLYDCANRGSDLPPIMTNDSMHFKPLYTGVGEQFHCI